MPGDRHAWPGVIRTAADVHRVLNDINQQGLTRGNTTALAHAVQQADEVGLRPDTTKLLPLPQPLHGLLPWPGGIRRGATVAMVGSTSLLMVLLAAATRAGWAAVVGMPGFGALAAHEIGCRLDRLALVPEPGPDWARVVGALMGGVDMVAAMAPGPVAEGTVRALQARAREHGTVLVPVSAWPAADLVLEVTGRRWEGLRQGRGRLCRQILDVLASGRGAAAKPRSATLALGDPPLDATRLVAALPPPDKQAYRTFAPTPVPNAPHGAHAELDLWSNLKPDDEPADPWVELMHHLSKIERSAPGTETAGQTTFM